MRAFTPLRLLVNSNLFISLCAMCMALQTYLVVGQPLKLWPLPVFVFFATLFIYTWHRLLSMKKRVNYAQSSLHQWVMANRGTAIIPIVSATIAMGISFWFLERNVQLVLVALGVLSSAYALPVLKTKDEKIRLRDIGPFKPFLLAAVWTGSTAMLPLMDMHIDLLSNEALLIMARRFLFMAAICIPFDIKDLEFDRATMRYPTLPLRLGVANTKWLAVCVLSLFVALTITEITSLWMSLALVCSYIYTVALIGFTTKKRSEYHYTFGIDSTMLVQFLLVWLATMA